MLPPKQGLVGNHLGCRCIHDRLIGNPHLAAVNGGLQVAFELAAFVYLDLHAATISGAAPTSLVLGMIERQIGAADQIINRCCVARKGRHADRCPD